MDIKLEQPPGHKQPIDSPEVVPSYKGEKITLSIEDVNALFNDIRKFNDQFSMGAIMAQLLIPPTKPESRGISPQGLSTVDEEAQMLTASGLDLIHRNVLDELGLELEPVSGKTARLVSSNQQIGEGEMRINIQDRTRFLTFLRALDPKQVGDSELRENLHSLSDVLAQQIFDHYNLEKLSDEALQLFGALEGIVDEYKRLGIGGVERLEAYLEHTKQGDLREFVLIEQQGLLSEPGKYFGPADWQRDTSPKELARRWNMALEVLGMTEANPKARDLYHQLSVHLGKCLREAMANLETLDYFPEAGKAELRKVLQSVSETFGK